MKNKFKIIFYREKGDCNATSYLEWLIMRPKTNISMALAYLARIIHALVVRDFFQPHHLNTKSRALG
jgi:hypothetical protein